MAKVDYDAFAGFIGWLRRAQPSIKRRGLKPMEVA